MNPHLLIEYVSLNPRLLQLKILRGIEGKRPLGRPRRRWVNNIRMDLGEVGCGDVD
jgi:hypothetical protein